MGRVALFPLLFIDGGGIKLHGTVALLCFAFLLPLKPGSKRKRQKVQPDNESLFDAERAPSPGR